MSNRIDFKAEAEALRGQLVAWRRDFHAHPELAFQERRSASIIADRLRELGYQVQMGIATTGVVGLLEAAPRRDGRHTQTGLSAGRGGGQRG